MGILKIFGHSNPDLDTVAATVGLAHLLKIRDGIDCEMLVLGQLNKEAKFVFNKFNIQTKLVLSTKLEDGDSVALVDHNEFSQSIGNIENAKIKMVVDHHKIDNFKTSEPLEYIAKPFGSTSTILYGLLKEVNGLDNKEVNALILSAIISDTLLFKSPTTTEVDKKAAKELAGILNIDVDIYGLDLLKAGADLSELSSDELIQIDSKVFDCNGLKVEIAQINAVDLNNILNRQDEIEESMKKVISLKDLDAFLVAVTDIINCNSEIIAIGNRIDVVEKAFNVKLQNNRAFLSGVVSRKKQLAPNIMEASK